MIKIKADVVTDIKTGTIKPCIVYAIGYHDDGYCSTPCAVALVDGKLQEYPIEWFANMEEIVE